MKLEVFAPQRGAAIAAPVTLITIPARGRPLRAMLLCLAWLLLPSLALAQNHPPVVEAGPSQTMYLGDSLTLLGTATDPDGDPILSWEWEIISAPTGCSYYLGGADTPDPTFTCNMVGDYLLTLVASDGLAWSDPDFVAITVVKNEPPTATISASPLQGPTPLLVSFDASASFDPEGGALTYLWSFGDGGFGIGTTASHEFAVPDIYSVSLKVTDDRGNVDFDHVEIAVAAYSVAPQSYDFADVAVGESSSMIFTVSWPYGAGALSLYSVSADPAGAFTVTTTPALPAAVTAETPVSVEVAFAPAALGLHEAELVFESDDPYVPSMRLPLSGTGVEAEPPPDTVAEILEFFDAAVASGSLAGDGPGGSAAGRLGALRNMIEAVDDLITAGNVEKACAQLQDVLNRCDGEPRPPDFVSGEAAAELNAYLTVLGVALGCP